MDVCAKPETMWPCLDSIGSYRLSISHICDEMICSPSGRLILMGIVSGWRLLIGMPGNIQCPVDPASTTAISVGVSIPIARNKVSVPIWF